MKPFLYNQLDRALLTEIASGIYAPDTRFISKREACNRWQVSDTTAKRVLLSLVDQGLLKARPRSGYYIHKDSQRKALLLLHDQTPLPANLAPPEDWETKRMKLLKAKGKEARQVAVILEQKVDIDYILADGPSNTPSRSYASSIFRELKLNGYNPHFFIDDGTPEARDRIVNSVLHQKLTGAIALRRTVSYVPMKEMLEPLRSVGIPIITMFDDCEELTVHSVNINNPGIGHEAASRLLEAGHRRLAVLLPNRESTYFGDRARGANMALQETGIEDATLDTMVWRSGTTPKRVVDILSDPKRRPTALILTSATIMTTLWPVLRSLRLSVPRRMSIILVAGETHAPPCPHALDTMLIDFSEIGRLAAQRLIGIMKGQPQPRTTLYDPVFVANGSIKNL